MKAAPRWKLVYQVACQLPGSFTAEALCVAAFREYPDVFGLEGFKDAYPDSQKVFCVLYGSRGLVKRGLLRNAQKGRKLFRCVPQAQREAV